MSAPPSSFPPLRVLLERAVHDLKNPLAVVRATLEWLDTELGARTDDVGDALRDATDATGRLAANLDHLRTFARLAELDGAPREDVDLAELASLAVQTVASRVSGRSFELSGGSATAHVDRELALEALTAIVEAAARHAPARAKLDVRIATDEHACEVVVAANEEAGVEAQASGTLAGAGLGLLLARAVLEAHEGALGVASGPRAVRLVARLPRPAR